MPSLTLVQAINDALRAEMRRDKNVVILGEDVGKVGGVFRVTDGLYEEFGADRVMDTPLAEAGIIGAAIGMALYGLKPVPEIQFLDFIYPAYDQIVSELAKFRYRSGGQYSCPLVIRSPYGGGIKGGGYHSQSSEAYFAHTPGLKVVIPSGPYDAKGLLISAIRDDDPVLFLEPKRVYRAFREEVPEGEYVIPIGKAKISVPGDDLTLIGYGAMMQECLAAQKEAAAKGISVEVLDLRSILPFDKEALLNSVSKTGRAVIVHEAPKTSGFGAEISATIAEEAVEYLRAPIVRVAGFDTPFPYTLEGEYMPSVARILEAIERVASF
ncbi:alpha-ketoacid dehydrogenase subunit beta [Candidatus Acetothermia bacterium]|nr:alpha-ketoacid dehydrogenase subunit beta [Candidatus Acetothermia bacterium]MBI3643337.1 alpha-ketoacid dehydrogenase subunit beta [Candidatus Acetothermia bacterium]